MLDSFKNRRGANAVLFRLYGSGAVAEVSPHCLGCPIKEAKISIPMPIKNRAERI